MPDGNGLADGGKREPDETLVLKQFDPADTSPSVAVVEALAAVDGLAPDTQFETSLYDYVDPEALDALLSHEQGAPNAVWFSVEDYRVRIDGDEIRVVKTDT